LKVFGEGIDILRREMEEDINELKTEIKYGFQELHTQINKLEESNQTEHKQIIQAVKDLDNEVQVEIKRVK
jgi:Sec-independent protein translocase protein TatA